MTRDELKTALAIEKPVVYNGMTYKCVSAIIWRKDDHGRRVVQAELMDMKSNSVTIVNPDRIDFFKDGVTKNI